jgi:hypothetical protein
MKKNLLLMMLCIPAMLVAQNGNGVTVSGLAVEAGTVTFNVSWDKDNPDMPALWSDTVWVFVDYNDAGVMKRLPVTGATVSAGTVTKIPNNDKGVWVVGNARAAGAGGFSATVKLLTTTADLAGACAYASNYPPVGEYTSATNISFAGTPPYDLTFEHAGSTFTLPSGSTYLLPANYTLLSFVDATGAPGIIHCLPPIPPTVVDAIFCFGLPGQLQAAASGNETIAWYDASTDGNLLYAGNVLPLTPLYNDAGQYYAEAVSEYNNNCVSARTAAYYTVNNCAITGDCPDFTAGSLSTATTPAACSAFYPGQIGTTNYTVACVSLDAGRIGKQN